MNLTKQELELIAAMLAKFQFPLDMVDVAASLRDKIKVALQAET